MPFASLETGILGPLKDAFAAACANAGGDSVVSNKKQKVDSDTSTSTDIAAMDEGAASLLTRVTALLFTDFASGFRPNLEV
jgi:hypothetical protein